MNVRSKYLFLSVGIATAVLLLLTTSLQATVIVDDSFADGDLTKTGALDTSWWTSSSSSGIEISPGSLGLVTGTSGRGIHTTFPEQTLANNGDLIKVSYSFATPATVGINRSTAFRVGLFDNLGRLTANNLGVDPNDNRTDECCLDATTNASSGSPNAAYGWGSIVGGPGSQTLPGYMFDHDVNTASDDLNFREHIVNTLTGTGRLMGTTGNFSNVSPSGPNDVYDFVANSSYSGMFIVRKLNATDFKLVGTLNTPTGSETHSVTDTFDSDNFSMLGFHANSNTFGSTNQQGAADNGIDFSNIKIEVIVPEPSTFALLMGTAVLGLGVRRHS